VKQRISGVFHRAHCRYFLGDLGNFLRRHDITRAWRIKHAKRNVRPLRDIFEEFERTGPAMHFHHRVLEIDDVCANLLRVQRELKRVLCRQRGRADLEKGTRLDLARLFDGNFGQFLALGHGQGPELGQTADQPQPIMIEIAQTIADQGAIGVIIDIVSGGAAERRIEGIAQPPQIGLRPIPCFMCTSHLQSPLSFRVSFCRLIRIHRGRSMSGLS
jgi:hypothetical protein